MVLFPVHAHQVDICTPVSLQSCCGRTVNGPPLGLHQDRSCVRQGIYIFHWFGKVKFMKSKSFPQTARHTVALKGHVCIVCRGFDFSTSVVLSLVDNERIFSQFIKYCFVITIVAF